MLTPGLSVLLRTRALFSNLCKQDELVGLVRHEVLQGRVFDTRPGEVKAVETTALGFEKINCTGGRVQESHP